MRRLCFIVGLFLCGFLAGIARAETYKLTTGETLEGETLTGSANEEGVQIKLGEGQYQRVPWAGFSQGDLKSFAKSPRLAPFVEPFIEITQAEKIKKTEVKTKQPPRLDRPVRQSLFSALLSSGLGWFVLLAIYAANIFAGYEVAIFRARPHLAVAGLAAVPVLGLLAPIIFLCLPTRVAPAEPALEAPAESAANQTQTAAAVNPMQTTGAPNPLQSADAPHPPGLHLARTTVEPASPAVPQTVIFQRGQYTFNRRFFETKLQKFFGVVRREEDRSLVMVIKSARGEYVGQRITRIASNDLHIQVSRGHASEEVMVPFQEVIEVQIKHSAA